MTVQNTQGLVGTARLQVVHLEIKHVLPIFSLSKNSALSHSSSADPTGCVSVLICQIGYQNKRQEVLCDRDAGNHLLSTYSAV